MVLFQHHRGKVLLFGALLALFGWLFWWSSKEPASSEVRVIDKVNRQTHSEEDVSQRSEPVRPQIPSPKTTSSESKSTSTGDQLAAIPAFQGTKVNGRARMNKSGELILDRDLRRLFDYFLTLRGLYSDQKLRQLISDYLASTLKGDALEEANDLLEQYFTYLDAVSDLLTDADHADQTDLKLVLEQRQNMRRSYLGSEAAEAFFAEQEAYEAHQLEAMRIGLQSDLSEQEKHALAENNDALLPPRLFEQRAKTFQFARLKQSLNEIQDPQERFATVAAQYGDEVAERFRKIEQDQKRWQEKLDLALGKHRQLAGRQDLTDADKRLLWDDYLASHFDAKERLRFRAIEQDLLDQAKL